jgi:hypothetical protein
MTKAPQLLAAALLLALPATAAWAEGRPVLLPTRDATVIYRVDSDQPGAPSEAEVHFRAGAARLRIAPRGMPGYLLVDRDSRKVTMVLPQQQIFLDFPLRGDPERLLTRQDDMQFTRRGEETVAGLRCTDWDMQSPDATGSGCVTADGVILRARGTSHGRAGGIEATSVVYAPQPQSLFEPPPDAKRLDLPKGLSGALLGGKGLSQ